MTPPKESARTALSCGDRDASMATGPIIGEMLVTGPATGDAVITACIPGEYVVGSFDTSGLPAPWRVGAGATAAAAGVAELLPLLTGKPDAAVVVGVTFAVAVDAGAAPTGPPPPALVWAAWASFTAKGVTESACVVAARGAVGTTLFDGNGAMALPPAAAAEPPPPRNSGGWL